MFKFHLKGPLNIFTDHNLKMLITLAVFDAYVETVGIEFPCYHSHKFSIEPKADFKQTHTHRHIKEKNVEKTAYKTDNRTKNEDYQRQQHTNPVFAAYLIPKH